MATSTPNLGLTKPGGTEQYNIAVANTNMDLIDTYTKNLDNRLDALDTNAVIDNGDAVTVSANWTLDAIKLYKIGKIVYGYFQVTRTTSAIAGSGQGNIANTPMFTLPAGYRPVIDATWVSGGGNSNGIFGGMIQSTGVCYVTVAAPNNGISIGDTLGASFFFMVP